MISLCTALFSFALFVQDAPEVSPEVAREWRVRALAMGDELWPEDVAELDWEERCLLLDAARRADPASLDERAASFVVSSLSHDHSNVRALALAAMRRLDRGLPPGRAEVLAKDLLPEVRLELATCLIEECDPELRIWRHAEPAAGAFEQAAAARAVLLDLSLDPDKRVRDRASAGLLSLGAVGLEEQLTWWLSTRVEDKELEFLRALELLSRGPANPELARWGRERFRSRGDLARAALWETCVERLGLKPRIDVLALGWTAQLTDDDGAESFRVNRLLEVAPSGGSELADLLMREARDAADDREKRELAAGFALSVDLTDGLLLGRLSLAEPKFLRWTWEALFGRSDSWDSEVMSSWLSQSLGEELRGAVFSAIAETLSRTGDDGARRLAEGLLKDASDPLFDSAFRALCDAPRYELSMEVLHAGWRRTEDPRRGELLRSLPRRVSPTPFRDDLLQRWRPGRSRDVSSLELLVTFVDDTGVSRAVCTYLAEHVAEYEESGLGVDSLLEGRLISLIHASRTLCGEEVLRILNRAMSAASLRSKEVVKACGAAMNESRSGRLLLADWVELETPSRARIEAAILVGELRPLEATHVLLERFSHCDPPLRVRILRALGRQGSGASQRFLEGVAAGAGLDAEVATEAIANSSHSSVGRVASLERISERTADPEVLRAAIAGLADAGVGDLDARQRAGRALLGVIDRAAESADTPRDELLVALARLGVEEEAFGALYLDLPVMNAESELEARFSGRSLPAREFLYRGDLRATAQLASHGRLAGGTWNQQLDAVATRAEGRLLIQLAAAASGGETADGVVRRLLVAAAVALEGEPNTPDVEVELARVYAGLLTADLGESRFKSAAAWASRLGRDWHLGVLSDRDLQRLFGGSTDALEAQAFLPASALHAQALLALSQGRTDAARELAERGRELAGESSLALEHQALLEAALKTVR
jgi:hypothetical protein